MPDHAARGGAGTPSPDQARRIAARRRQATGVRGDFYNDMMVIRVLLEGLLIGSLTALVVVGAVMLVGILRR